MMLSTALRSSAVFLVLAQALAGKCQAQQVSYERATPQQLAGIAKDNSRHFGDDPDDGGPIATDLSASEALFRRSGSRLPEGMSSAISPATASRPRSICSPASAMAPCKRAR